MPTYVVSLSPDSLNEALLSMACDPFHLPVEEIISLGDCNCRAMLRAHRVLPFRRAVSRQSGLIPGRFGPPRI